MTVPAYAPELEDESGLFPALLAGLREFRARVEGTEVDAEGQVGRTRARLLGLQGESGIVVDVVTAVLQVLADLLSWLRDAIGDLDRWIVQIDALFAAIELLGAGIAGLGDAMAEFDDWPDSLPFDGQVFTDVSAIGSTLEDGVLPPTVIPSASTLQAIVAETEALVGTATPETAGSLELLRVEILAPPP